MNSMAINKWREKKDEEKKGIMFDMFLHFLWSNFLPIFLINKAI